MLSLAMNIHVAGIFRPLMRPSGLTVLLCAADRSIADNFARCEANQQKKAREKRDRSLSQVKRADGARAVFSRRAREALPAEVKDTILKANWMDVALHELASELADKHIKEAASKGPLPVCSWCCLVLPTCSTTWSVSAGACAACANVRHM